MYSETVTAITTLPGNSRDEMLIQLQDVADKLISFYLSVSCPCAFPRFSFLASFCGDEYTKGLLHTFETNIITGAALRHSNFLTKDEKHEDMYSCIVCGTGYLHVYEQFSITFELVRLVTNNNKAAAKGAVVQFPFPLFGGIYFANGALNDEEIQKESDRLQEKFPKTGLEEFIQYMKASI